MTAEETSFASTYTILQRLARESGYKLAMIIDVDERAVMAAPWSASCVGTRALMESVLYEFDLPASGILKFHRRPLGRLMWHLPTGDSTFFDLSVLPRHGTAEL